MDELLNGLIQKVGLDRDKAEKVIAFLKENAGKIGGLLGVDATRGMVDKVGGMLGGLKEPEPQH